MTARIEVTSASALEMENVTCKDGKLSGEPIFFKKGSLASVLVFRAFDEAGQCINTSLIRVSSEGHPSISDRTRPVVKPTA